MKGIASRMMLTKTIPKVERASDPDPLGMNQRAVARNRPIR
jgi:hypothetical protein